MMDFKAKMMMKLKALNMVKGRAIAIGILIPGFFVMVSFQNCAPVNFQSAVPQSSLKQSGTPDEDIAGEQTAPTPEPPKSCLDDKGITRTSGETWIVANDFTQDVTCPDADAVKQDMRKKDSYLCNDGAISMVGSVTTAVNPPPACPAPSLMVSANPMMAPEGSTADVLITSGHVSEVKYTCKKVSSASVLTSGNATPGAAHVPVKIDEDVKCDVVAKNSAGTQVDASVTIPVTCGNKIKSGGKCVEFTCKEFRTITITNGLLEVPARTEAGICYTVKLMDAIEVGASNLTTAIDTSVTSRSHDSGGGTRHPYQLGKSVFDLKLLGARQVKLAGSGSALSPILVDNFVVAGIIPKAATPSVSHYNAYGSSDSTIPGTNGILLGDTNLPLQAFATGGTSTIAPLDITNQIVALNTFTLDLRALDCGGSRRLSDIYLLLQ